MTGFRIERSRFGNAPRVYHESNDKLAVALILKEADGKFSLFPVRWVDVPAPLTGQSTVFADERAIRIFLGIEGDDHA